MDNDAMNSSVTDSDAIDSDDSSSFEPLDSFICDICQGLGDMKSLRGFILKLEPDEQKYDEKCYVYTYMHHPNVGALLASANSGCKACTIVCNDLRIRNKDIFNRIVSLYSPNEKSKHPEPVAHATQLSDDISTATQFAECAKQKRAFTEERLGSYNNGRVVLVFRCDKESGPRGSSSDSQDILVWALTAPLLQGYLSFFNSPYESLDIKFEHRPSHDLLSSHHIGLINRWRDTCKLEHRSCHTAAHSRSFPSRVLELLGSGEKGNECEVRLIETHGTMREEYACLSYCWGYSVTQTQIGETTRANLSKHFQGISFDGLPKTIIDAIYLCYKLGFRFLWVDRLCIIQDDARDWEMEACRMCDIYSRSAMTITAPSCIRSSQSFLERRQNAYPFGGKGLALIESINAESESKSNLWLCEGGLGPGRASWFLESSWDNFTIGARAKGNCWITRGWTFQEWMLSPRVLHIDTMTLWDCFEGYANELNRRYTERAHLLRNPGEYGKSLSWELIVEEYTRRGITYEKDRLPALAGLASRYRQATGHTYLAGLWLEEMPRSLLWQRADNPPPSGNETNTPSWSWASVAGAARYEYEFSDTRRSVASFNSSVSICAWPDSPSLVSGHVKAWIDIKGYITVVTGQTTRKDYGNPGCLEYCYVVAGDEYWESIIDRRLEYPEEEIIQSNIHLIVLGSVSIESEPGCRGYGALVLQKCGRDDDPPCFKRLGVAYLGIDGDPVPDLEYEPPWKLQLVRLV